MYLVSDTDEVSLFFLSLLGCHISHGYIRNQKLAVAGNDSTDDFIFSREPVCDSFYFDLQ